MRVEGRLGWDRDGEKNVMGRIEAVKMLSGRDSLSWKAQIAMMLTEMVLKTRLFFCLQRLPEQG